MLKLITTLTFFLFGWLVQSQEIETRNICEFSKINVKNATVVYTESDKSSLKIESEYNDTSETIETKISNGTLTITGKNAGEKTVVYLSANGISEIKASSHAKITVNNQMTASQLKITLHSGAIFNGNLEAKEETTIIAKGGASFKGLVNTGSLKGHFSRDTKSILCGTAKNATLTTTANALCNARNLTTETVTIAAQDRSNVSVFANNGISINVTDEAKVIYKGSPANVKLDPSAIVLSQPKGDRIVTYNY